MVHLTLTWENFLAPHSSHPNSSQSFQVFPSPGLHPQAGHRLFSLGVTASLTSAFTLHHFKLALQYRGLVKMTLRHFFLMQLTVSSVKDPRSAEDSQDTCWRDTAPPGSSLGSWGTCSSWWLPVSLSQGRLYRTPQVRAHQASIPLVYRLETPASLFYIDPKTAISTLSPVLKVRILGTVVSMPPGPHATPFEGSVTMARCYMGPVCCDQWPWPDVDLAVPCMARRQRDGAQWGGVMHPSSSSWNRADPVSPNWGSHTAWYGPAYPTLSPLHSPMLPTLQLHWATAVPWMRIVCTSSGTFFAWIIPADLSKLRASVVSASSSGCFNKIWTGWLKKLTFISHNSGGWEVQDQGAGRFGVSWGLSARFADHHLLCVLTWQGERELWSLPLLIRTLTASSFHHLNLITSQTPHLQIHDFGDSGFSIWIWEDTHILSITPPLFVWTGIHMWSIHSCWLICLLSLLIDPKTGCPSFAFLKIFYFIFYFIILLW